MQAGEADVKLAKYENFGPEKVPSDIQGHLAVPAPVGTTELLKMIENTRKGVYVPSEFDYDCLQGDSG